MSGLPTELLRILGVGMDFAMSPLPGNENENYLLESGERSFVVKRLRAHTADNTELEGIYRKYLATGGLTVVPYLPLDGNACVYTSGEESFVAMPYVQGDMAVANAKVVNKAATLLAKTHMLSTGDLPSRQSWYRKNYIPDSLNLINDTYADAKKAFVVQLAEYPDFWNNGLPKGIIHGDLQEDNILVDKAGNIVSVLDWEETAVEPLLIDVAHSAQQFSFERGVCNRILFDAFMLAYQNSRPLTDLEKELFDMAFRYSMLVLSVWAHVKMSRHEVSDDLFQRVGNYYRASYDIPKISR